MTEKKIDWGPVIGGVFLTLGLLGLMVLNCLIIERHFKPKPEVEQAAVNKDDLIKDSDFEGIWQADSEYWADWVRNMPIGTYGRANEIFEYKGVYYVVRASQYTGVVFQVDDHGGVVFMVPQSGISRGDRLLIYRNCPDRADAGVRVNGIKHMLDLQMPVFKGLKTDQPLSLKGLKIEPVIRPHSMPQLDDWQ